MRTAITVAVPGFEGAFTCTIEIDEFKYFLQLLHKLYDAIGSDCEICWSNMEANIEFSFKLDRLGRISGSYKFSLENFTIGPTLSGDFSADQAYVEGWIKQAREVIENAA